MREDFGLNGETDNMPKRSVKAVQYNGEGRELHSLIGRWNQIRGVQWSVAPCDYVGGSFDVTFTRAEGSISLEQAKAWVDLALQRATE